jgi:ferritin
MGQITSKVLTLLRNQYSHEMKNHVRYLVRASWARYRGLENTAVFFEKEAEGEKGHADAVRKYIEDRNETIDSADIVASETFNLYPELFLTALEVERETTDLLNAIFLTALQESDFQTLVWVQGLVSEQTEEENLYQTILDRISSRGGNGSQDTNIIAFSSDPAAVHDIDTWIGSL